MAGPVKGPNPKPREILFIDVVLRHDPQYERERLIQKHFEFTRRNFYYNPRTSGPYQPVAFGFSNGFSNAFQTITAVWEISNGFE